MARPGARSNILASSSRGPSNAREPGTTARRALPALLRGAVEGLGQSLERIAVDRFRAAAGGAAHDEVGALAHGIDQPRLLGRILDPGAVALGVHGELGGADLGGRVGRALERIAADNPELFPHVLGRPRAASPTLPLTPPLPP